VATARPEIVAAGAERLDDLQPLWESLSEHHARIAPQLGSLGPLRTPRDSWSVRRRVYEDIFAEADAFVLLAELGGAPVGYALAHLREPEETWATGPVAELDTLAVLPEHRGGGIGGELMRALFAELRRRGATHWVVGTIASNAEAIRFYGRFGPQPFVTQFIGGVP
jgi:GNAT superfamily N-acetyltransferase